MSRGEREHRGSDGEHEHDAREIAQRYELSIARMLVLTDLYVGKITAEEHDQRLEELEQKANRGDQLFPTISTEEFIKEGLRALQELEKLAAEWRKRKR